jgi:hypothetical protein
MRVALTLLDQIRTEIRKNRYSIQTEDAYYGWIRQLMLFHDKLHPKDMGENERPRRAHSSINAGK